MILLYLKERNFIKELLTATNSELTKLSLFSLAFGWFLVCFCYIDK